jgi:hypothetical protein
MRIATSCLRLALGLAGLALALALVPRLAHAQSAEAEALFQEGKRLMTRGETARACEKFEASDRVEPASGTEINLARCRETSGQIASAWAAYLKTAATAKHDGNTRREAEARKKAAALEPRLIHLTIVVPDDSRVDGLVIKRNDTAVDAALWNQRAPVDPDEYTISAEAPNHQPWSTSIAVRTRDKKVEVPPLEKRPEARRTEPRRDSGEPDDRAAVRPAEASLWTGKRKLSIALVAVGVAAAGAGIGLGLHASSLERQSDDVCDHAICHSADAVALNQSARRYALAANLGFAAGGAAVAGAAVLWFLGAPRVPAGPRSDATGMIPILGAGHVGLALVRSF